MPVTITTRVDDKLVKLIDDIAEKEGMDRSTVLRRFLIRSAGEWLLERSLKEYEDGKISLWQAAERCGISLWEIIDETAKRSVYVPYTLEDFNRELGSLDG
jgi:predicted HTH domain antitoxin